VVQFSHFSVKEYLTSDRLARLNVDVSRYHILLEPAHTILAQACLGVLLRLDDGVDKDNFGDIPLVKYAAGHLFDHAGFENVASHIRDALEYFFDADNPHWTAWCRIEMTDVEWEAFATNDDVVDAYSPLYFASLGGFYDLAEHLVGRHPEHINAKSGRMLTPLVAALGGKHFHVAELLHQNGADVNVRDVDDDTPLREASWAGAVDIVEWLLNHGADVNVQGHQGWSPLHSAAKRRHRQVFQMLIEHNADIQIQNQFGQSPLHVAAGTAIVSEHVDTMQVLLDRGANPNARDKNGSTPLHHSCGWSKGSYSSRNGTVEGTRLLLMHGATIDAEDNDGMTPLQLALENRCHDIVACLKEHGATR
jgi:ankyrin repeat protein